MTKNLETADGVVKFALAGATIVLFLTGVIAGPFAKLLVILSCITISIFIVRKIISAGRSKGDSG